MIIGIQKGLEGIKNALEQKGHKVVYYDEYPHPIDAYIYSGNQADGMLESLQVTNMTATSINHGDGRHSMGVLMINAHNKDIHMIEHILQNRTYSPLL